MNVITTHITVLIIHLFFNMNKNLQIKSTCHIQFPLLHLNDQKGYIVAHVYGKVYTMFYFAHNHNAPTYLLDANIHSK
jgi:hypothetical protein